MNKAASFSDLVGKTITEIHGAVKESDEITFVCSDGSEYYMSHCQDCCETVDIEDVCGDIQDLIGSTILKAEESMSEDNPVGVKVDEYQDSFTWTFYHIATIKGHVTIRWYGQSNGYYSEEVDFEMTKKTRATTEQALADKANQLKSNLVYEFQGGLHTRSMCACGERLSRGSRCYLCLIKEFLRESN